MLSLRGHFEYIDKYSRLKFIFTDDESRNKLQRLCGGGRGPFPYDEKGFTVHFPMKVISQDIKDMVGLDVIVKIVTKEYKFESKLEKNKGQIISGLKL